ncbi:hypothetical protein [Bifidobacterium simiarum]|uniref:hypothetical protein n=1 Tax=Bifidobacterium simiarum TaxID=2045441 RepID=UPI001BDBC326|nr:hypothetical protein [Bifidobacterium simiarum]MBT1167317.1 hypothetical protein [Bifidobacterium simiarum]
MSGWTGIMFAAGLLTAVSGMVLWWAFTHFGGMTGAWTWLWKVALILVGSGVAAMEVGAMADAAAR